MSIAGSLRCSSLRLNPSTWLTSPGEEIFFWVEIGDCIAIGLEGSGNNVCQHTSYWRRAGSRFLRTSPHPARLTVWASHSRCRATWRIQRPRAKLQVQRRVVRALLPIQKFFYFRVMLRRDLPVGCLGLPVSAVVMCKV